MKWVTARSHVLASVLAYRDGWGGKEPRSLPQITEVTRKAVQSDQSLCLSGVVG